MRLWIRISFFAAAAVVLLLGGIEWSKRASASQALLATPARQKEILVPVNVHSWWLAQWKDNAVVCTVSVEHEGLPTAVEVFSNCGSAAYNRWIATAPCPDAALGGSTQNCPGLYLYYIGQVATQRVMVVDLPLPTIRLTLSGCVPTPPQNICYDLPALVFYGDEPLPNEQITALHIRMGANFYDCPGYACQLPLQPTSLNGTDIEFWADSSFGDSTKRFTGRVRVVDGGISAETGRPFWIVDVYSTQWLSQNNNSCTASWEAFLPIGEPPNWLKTPDSPAGLASETPFVFLAGQLISMNVVDATECENGGLLSNGAANICGLDKARLEVNDWQNIFDEHIWNASQNTQIPAQLLKNIFAQESQFWPGEIIKDEFGLGQLTDLGADTALLWNVSFYNEFCRLVFYEDTCAKGYAQLTTDQQAILRGALASRTNANCPTCDQGIDLAHAANTVDLFAQTLLGNCEQVAYMVHGVTGKTPGAVSTYEDLWRYTLVNYNAGAGCLLTALQNALRQDGTLNWQTVSSRLSPTCQNAIQYVERVTRDRLPTQPEDLATPEPFSTPTPGGYPAPTQPAFPTATPSGGYPAPTSFPTPTTSPGGYPEPTLFPTQPAYP